MPVSFVKHQVYLYFVLENTSWMLNLVMNGFANKTPYLVGLQGSFAAIAYCADFRLWVGGQSCFRLYSMDIIATL